ncbi:DUF3987 domain-containing protein [Blastococcus sp. BMG 814]|uniref:DUF3987 domain-containing protein n=1 Tax=Blastococcus carthaginiensis TaxID=3050034 RepID=A0ABT9ICF6_9ACTN|nr:DUF3987 domain-containing protein [Blastococcus carthaginiensis]MDP5183253.1 DUF3987 domain-containing protein [Blastococcus carthaginiensis]
MGDAAYYGVAGLLVRRLAEQTEADPAAMLTQFLVGFGNMLGRGCYWPVGGSRNYTNEFLLIIGPTARGRKGTGWDMVEHFLRLLEPDYIRNNKRSGIVSGEALVWRMRDGEGGVDDKRSLEMQSEFSGTLKLMGKDGNILSQIIRDLWDGKPVATESKTQPASCSEPHLSLIGHVTEAELARYTSATELANGFMNRFLFVASYMTKEMPFPGDVEDIDYEDLLSVAHEALRFGRQHRAFRFSERAKPLWPDLYSRYAFVPPGIWGEATSRASGHIFRLAMLFAILDLSREVEPEHVRAAVSVWEHSRTTALYVFGDSLGEPAADELWEAVKDIPAGVSATEVRDLFSRNRTKRFLDTGIKALVRAGRLHEGTRPPTGPGSRAVRIWLPVDPGTVRPSAAQRDATKRDAAMGLDSSAAMAEK